MKRLILSRLWMLISIIILTTGQVWAKTTEPTTTKKVFNSIKELRDGAQTMVINTMTLLLSLKILIPQQLWQ